MRIVKAGLIVTFAAMPLSVAAQTEAQGSAVSALRSEVARLTEIVEVLRDEVATLKDDGVDHSATHDMSQTTTVDARSALHVSGDFRYRYELIDVENEDSRERQRFRARIRAARDFGDSFRVGLGLASGGDSPTSGTQSFDDGASSKEVDIDQAWFEWRTPVDGLTLTGGKMRNPFRRAGSYGLLWDGEFFPEGVALDYRYANGYMTVAEFLLDERPAAEDAWLLGIQAGHAFALGGEARLTFGAGYFDYRGVEGRLPLFDPAAAAGNTLDALGRYAFDYDEIELFAELAFPWSGLDVDLFADYVRNLRAGRHDDGYALGLRVRDGAGGPWRLGYVYQDLAADAVLGAFTGSDFAGGGTDKLGHHLMLDYEVRDDVTARMTWYLNERGEDRGSPENYQRVQADINYRW